MAVDKLVDSTQLDADLTSVANAIRTKGGTSAQMAFPAGFVQAIGDIPSGGGTDYLQIRLTDAAQTTTIDWTYSNPNITQLPPYAFFNCKNLISVDLPNVDRINGVGAFNDCSKLSKIYLPKAISFPGSNFQRCAALETAVFPLVNTLSETMFTGDTSLQAVDLGVTSGIQAGAFNTCTSLATLVLRRSSAIVTLYNVNAFINISGNLIDVYVPNDLITLYQNDTNWSAVSNVTLTFKKIEGSIYENYYVDGTPIPST